MDPRREGEMHAAGGENNRNEQQHAEADEVMMEEPAGVLNDFLQGIDQLAGIPLAQIPGIPPEWLQPGYQLDAQAEDHLLSYIINNLQRHAHVAMTLTNEERNQALAIKEAVREADDLQEISDMWYAHLALIDGDDVEAAVDRARHFQIFRDEYGLADTAEEGSRIMRALFKKQPDAVLSVSYNAVDGNYIYIYDQAAFDPHVVKSPEDWKVMMGYCYYLFQAMSPDLVAIRQGCVFIGECDGFNFSMINVDVVRRFWDEVFSVYPMRIKELKCFHSGVVANLLLSILKPFFPKNLQRMIGLGCQFEQRLDKYYSVPTREIAVQKILSEIDSFLLKRYTYEREFVL